MNLPWNDFVCTARQGIACREVRRLRRRVAALPWTRQAAPKQPYSEVAPVPPECRVPVLVFPFRRHSLADKQMDTLGIEPRASRMLSGCDTTTPCAPLLLEVVAAQGQMSSREGTKKPSPAAHGKAAPTANLCTPWFVAQLQLTLTLCVWHSKRSLGCALNFESHTSLSFGRSQCGWGTCPCGGHVAEVGHASAWQ